MTVREFVAALVRPEGTGTWTFFTVPFDTSTEFGTRSRVQVKGSIDGLPYRGTLLPSGEGNHFMVVKKEIRDTIGKTAGDKVRLRMEIDSATRSVMVPKDLRLALEGNSKAKTIFNAMAYSHQRAYVEWIEQAKKKETRTGRIRKAVVWYLKARRSRKCKHEEQQADPAPLRRQEGLRQDRSPDVPSWTTSDEGHRGYLSAFPPRQGSPTRRTVQLVHARDESRIFSGASPTFSRYDYYEGFAGVMVVTGNLDNARFQREMDSADP